MNCLYKINYLLICLGLLGCNRQTAKTTEIFEVPATAETLNSSEMPPVSGIVYSITPTENGYKVQDFSDYYYAIVEIDPEDDDVFQHGSITVYDKQTGKELIRVDADQLAITLREGEVEANVKELPYGEQSIIISEDFNFDGKVDIAIKDGQYSCYSGPSYQIYLQGNNRELIHSEPFTRLAHEYCGMFQVDTENERLHTMTKSGCCWHQYSEFMVKDNAPHAVRVVEVNGFSERYYATEITVEEWNENGSSRELNAYLEQMKEEDVLLSFTMPHNGKTVYFHTIENDKVNYFIVDKDKQIELDLFYKVRENDFNFYYNQKDEIYFQVPGAGYTLYEKTDPDGRLQYGIRVKTGGKEYNYPADLSTVTGSITNLGAYTNLIEPE